MTIFNFVRSFAGRLLGRDQAEVAADAAPLADLPREDADFAPIWAQCKPYTMTTFPRGLALYRAIRHLVQNDIPGDIVECGVWRGGSTMIAMAALKHFGAMDRRVRLLDTFQGMTEPGDADVDLCGVSAQTLLDVEGGKADGMLCYASLDEVKRNVASIGYPSDLVEFIEGDIRETALAVEPREIALLRLDTDFYESTKVELEVFYPWLREKGVLIIDDYGHWEGSRRAVEEYFDGLRSRGAHAPMLSIIDYTGRLAVK